MYSGRRASSKIAVLTFQFDKKEIDREEEGA